MVKLLAINTRLSDISEGLEHLKKNLNGPLTSILTLNTIAHTVGAMGVGAQVAGLTGGGFWEHLAGGI